MEKRERENRWQRKAESVTPSGVEGWQKAENPFGAVIPVPLCGRNPEIIFNRCL
ncbi:MAG: hypothetical protein V2J62_04650 [candidate division KSB1 bacterium]|nr:hypothetical protein [candidate division KSB1 bacterium]